MMPPPDDDTPRIGGLWSVPLVILIALALGLAPTVIAALF